MSIQMLALRSNSQRRFNLSAGAALLCALAAMPMSAPLFALELTGTTGAHERAQGYLGVDFRDTTEEQVNALHLQGPHGAEIMMVDHDGPAGKAGLCPHDVVLQMNGQNIENSEDLRRKIRESSPGASVSISIVRQGRAMSLTAKLANRGEVERLAWEQMSVPDSQRGTDAQPVSVVVEHYTIDTASTEHSSAHGQSFIGTVLRTTPYTGASVETMSPQLAGFFGAPPKSGLLVHGVEAKSPAAAAGLRAGDVVLRVDANPVNSTSDWGKRLRAGVGRAITLTVLRDKHEQTLTMLPDLKRHSLLEWPKLF